MDNTAYYNTELAIIIPTLNEELYISKTLYFLKKQDYKNLHSTQIIIADAKSSDRTIDVIQKSKEHLNITLIEGDLPSIGRNRAAKLTKAEFMLFLDGDIELQDKTIISATLKAAKNKNLDLVTAKVRCSGNFFGKLFYWFSNLRLLLSIFTKPYCTGRFMLIKKTAFDQLGGFDEKLEFYEDVFLASRVNANKFTYINHFYITSDRRLLNTGAKKIFWLQIRATWHNLLGNNKFFYKNHHYWDHLKK